MVKSNVDVVNPGGGVMVNRRSFLTRIALGVFTLLVSLGLGTGIAQPVTAVRSVGFTVSDLNRAVDFYTQVLDFRKVSEVEVYGRDYDALQGVFGVRMRVVGLQLGQERLELTEYLTPAGLPIPLDSRSNDLWFQHIAIVVRDMPRAYQRLREYNVRHVSVAPQTLPATIPAAAGIQAFYFQDPDRHNLELIYFPPDKGDPRWQRPTSNLFLGIDHTAIAISDTAKSLAFYQELGFRVAGDSENFGPEQEYLNHVEGVRLRITGLKVAQGMGIEFLDYRQPTDGRPRPANARASDLLHWETTLSVSNLPETAARLQTQGVTFVSRRVVTLPDDRLGFRQGILVPDPDGHVLRLVQS
ncbi:VOC family protein [Gloeomargarita lithophora]|nr:VOC family protein [Gloeomargarita lithophora]